VAAGDVVVLGTDGLFDNVFDGELASTVMHSLMAGRSPSTAEHIASLARIPRCRPRALSPFARAAMEAGYRSPGGRWMTSPWSWPPWPAGHGQVRAPDEVEPRERG